MADQILRQIFHFGLGEIEVAGADIRIGDTPVADYEHLTLAPPPDARGLIDWRADGFDRQGRPERRTADIAIEARRAGGGGAWTRLGAETLGHDETAPFRRGAAWDLAGEGTWEVRVRRTSAPADDDRSGDELTWAALRSYQTDAADYTGQRRLGLSIRASGQLSGPVDRLSALVRQKAPRWRGRAWSAAPAAYSSSPAAVMLLYLRGIRVQGRVVAGAGLPDDRIDLAGLGAWHDWCAAHDPALRCDLALDRTIGHARVIETIARCGRASPTWQSGRLGVVWDAADRPATAMITPGNIVAGSLEVDWAAGRGADEIACRYLEPGLDWQWNTVRRTVPGADDPPASTATLTLAGVTTREHAAMECNLQAARQRYHRRRIAWETGPEGLSIRRADVVHLSHGLLDGGRTGRLVALHDDGCTLDRAVRVAGEAATDWLMLRRPDGAPETVRAHAGPPASDARANGADTARVWTAPAPERGVGEPVDTLWRLYPAGAGPAKVKVVGVSPRAGDRVRIEAIDELGAYYAAAVSDLSVELPQIRRNLPRVLHAAVSETLIRVGAAFLVEIALSLTVAGDWRGAEVRASWERRPMRTVASLDGGDTEARWTSPPEGWIEIVVLPRGGGPPHRIAYTVRGLRTPPGAVTEARVERLGAQRRGEVFTATERTRLANLSEPTPTPTPTPTPRPTPRGRKTFTTPGSFTWRAPAGVTRVRVQLRGGSGGDGDGYTWTWSGRGGTLRETYSGGDGGFIYFEIAVSPGTSYSLTAGGNGADGAERVGTRHAAAGEDTAAFGGTARGGKGGRRAVSGRAGTDGADGGASAPAGASGVSRHTQLTVPSPVSAGYIVIEWG